MASVIARERDPKKKANTDGESTDVPISIKYAPKG